MHAYIYIIDCGSYFSKIILNVCIKLNILYNNNRREIYVIKKY